VTNWRVLIVDDNEDITSLMRLQLDRTDGAAVVGTATDGAAAIQMANEVHPNMILLDMMMPGMGGLEALPILRELVPEARIIMFSAGSFDNDRARALELGADDYFVKGDALDLLDTLAAVDAAS
jgi:CheY-like chemotaxis protein